MPWLKVLQIASGITTIMGLCAFVAVLYLWYASRQKERSIRQIVTGEGIIRPESVVEILKQFSNEEARLEALQRILGHDTGLSEKIIKRISKVDVGTFSVEQQHLWTRRLFVVGMVLLALSLVAAVYSKRATNVSSSSEESKQSGRRVPKPDQIPQATATKSGEIAFQLDDDFIDRYKDRAAIHPKIQVDIVGRPHPPRADGDLHVSGRAEEVLLPLVAEVMNAASRLDAVQKFRDAISSKEVLWISGAWRLWPEYGGDAQEQGAELSPMASSAPPHVFEVHPVTRVEKLWLGDTLKPIEGFQAKDANRAFKSYDSLLCTVERDVEKKTTTIITQRAGYNYVEFIMQIVREPVQLEDGRAVTASVVNLNNEAVTSNRRMIFVQGTPPDTALDAAKVGQRLHVLGIPRISLSALRNENLTGKHALPYEMIIVAVYGS
jgi:hypothetical protein